MKLPPHRIAQGGASSGQALIWNGTDWAPAAATDAGAIQKSLVDAKGDLIAGTANDTVARLAVGTDGQALLADSAQTTGLRWGTVLTDPTTTKGDLLARTASALARLGIGSDGQILTADAASTPGMKWANPAGGYTDPLTTKGDLVGRSASATVRLPVGSNGQVLTADSADANGVKWATPAAGSGMTQSYLGKNAIGASYETFTANKHLMKKITLASAGMINSIDAYVKDSGSGQVGSLAVAVASDVSGTPTALISLGSGRWTGDTVYLSTTARWLSVPVGLWLAAGDYWLMVCDVDSTSIQIAYDGSGSDRYYTSGGVWIADPTLYANTTGSNDYSIRASIVR